MNKLQLENRMRQAIGNIEQLGYEILEQAVMVPDCQQVLQQFTDQTQDDSESSLSTSRGTVFAARNLIDEFPPAVSIWRQSVLLELLQEVLGPQAGLVRVLFFDKPSDRSWNLPWHKDMTVAVKDNSIPTSLFCKPTNKAGVDHFEAPTEILEQMLTLRLHLDRVTNQNGPLRVIPGSHSNGKQAAISTDDFATINANVGDVLAMRPLISHSSGHAEANTGLHRRILHFEFCGVPELPDQIQWHRFIPITG